MVLRQKLQCTDRSKSRWKQTNEPKEEEALQKNLNRDQQTL